MIGKEKLAAWKALAEAAPPVRLGEQPIYLETEEGRHVAAVGLVAGPHVSDLHNAALFAAARPAILALVAEVERLQGSLEIVAGALPRPLDEGEETVFDNAFIQALRSGSATDALVAAGMRLVGRRKKMSERLQKDADLDALREESSNG